MSNLFDLPSKLSSKIVPVTESGCWLWVGAAKGGKAKNKYGNVNFNGRTMLAHRAVYEQLKGPIADNLTIDHLCKVTLCVNPEHLEPVTPRINSLRSESPVSINAFKMECDRGHALSGVNMYLDTRGKRVCLECRKIRGRKCYLMSKQQVNGPSVPTN